MGRTEWNSADPDRFSNPLDYITAGPPPTPGPQAWRSDRAPMAMEAVPRRSRLRGGRGPGKRPGRRRRTRWILALAVIAAVVVAAIAVRPLLMNDGAAPTAALGLSVPAEIAPATPGRALPQPTLADVAVNPTLTAAAIPPSRCLLPDWGVSTEAMQAFADVASACYAQVWAAPAVRFVVFEDPSGVPPGSRCDGPVQSLRWCADKTAYFNRDALMESAGNQAGAALLWFALAAADAQSARFGQSADIATLIRGQGSVATESGLDIRRRQHFQQQCLAGAAVNALVDHGIGVADRDAAQRASRVWTVLGEVTGDRRYLHAANNEAWFAQGAAGGPRACALVWTASADRVD